MPKGRPPGLKEWWRQRKYAGRAPKKGRYMQHWDVQHAINMQVAFLVQFAATGSVTKSVEAVSSPDDKLTYERVRRWLAEDETFRGMYADARLKFAESLELEAHRRGVQGIARSIYFQGEVVGTERQYSDTLLLALLKANLPDKYRDRVDIKVDVQRELQRIADELGVPLADAEAEWRALEPKLLSKGT